MFSASASFYDELYAFRDFDGEARQVLEHHRAETGRLPRRILDVGCATGDHAAALARHGRCEVWGIDIETYVPRPTSRVVETPTLTLARASCALVQATKSTYE